MQINNWSDLIQSRRISKTPRDLENDLVILGTYTGGGAKKQDPWQPYAMTLNDLAAAIGGGGGGGTGSMNSFSIEGDGLVSISKNGGTYTSGPEIITDADIVTILVQSVPSGLNWRGLWTNTTSNYEFNDVVYFIDNSGPTPVYYTYWMKNDTSNPPAGSPLPYTTSVVENTYWAQLGIQGPKGATGDTGDAGDNGYRTGYLRLYKWAATLPSGTFPSGNSTYTWSTGEFTNPTLNGWSATPTASPTAGHNLYMIQEVIYNNTTSTTSTVSWSGTYSPIVVGKAGNNGSDGNAATIAVGSVDTGAAGSSANVVNVGTSAAATFNFTIPRGDKGDVGSSIFYSASGAPAGATGNIGDYYVDAAVGTFNGPKLSASSWSGVNSFSIKGANGAAGGNGTNGTDGRRSVYIDLYKWSLSLPTSNFPSGNSTYTWTNGGFTDPGTLNGWSKNPGAPSQGQTLYKVSAFYTDLLNAATSTITWPASPTPIAVGSAGLNGAVSVLGFIDVNNNYTISATDIGQVLIIGSLVTSNITITVPDLTDLNYPVGTQTMIIKRNAAQYDVTVVAGSNITLTSADNMNTLRSVGSAATIIKRKASTTSPTTLGEWYLFGDLAGQYQ